MTAPGRDSFERPYGLAWLLTLSAELPGILDPLAEAAWNKLEAWIRKLPYPDRSGQHANTAFAFKDRSVRLRPSASQPVRMGVFARIALYGNGRQVEMAFYNPGDGGYQPRGPRNGNAAVEVRSELAFIVELAFELHSDDV